VAVPPEEGIYNGQVYLVWSSEDTLATALIALSPLPQSGVTDDGDEMFLRPSRLVSMLDGKLSLTSCLRQLWLDNNIVFNDYLSLSGVPVLSSGSIRHPCKVVVLPESHRLVYY
jgi:hypothetical protein